MRRHAPALPVRLVPALVAWCACGLAPVGTEAAGASPEPALTLVTIDPGPDLYSAWGHTALRVQDAERGRDYVYDFGVFRYLVNDSWQQVLAHDPAGQVASGSVHELADAFSSGRAVKVGIRDLNEDLAVPGEPGLAHEVFVELGSCYYYTGRELFMAGSHPIIRVRPDIPLRYESRAWDFGWLMLRTDGHVVFRCYDPYTLDVSDTTSRRAIRWFVR